MEFFVVLLVPAVAVLLRHTKAWWIPGAVLLVAAGIAFTEVEHVKDDVIGAMANGLTFLGGLGLCALSLIAFVLGGIKRNPMLVEEPALVAQGRATPLAHREPME